MKKEIETFPEAIVAASHERISQRLHDRSYSELRGEYAQTHDPQIEEMLQAVHSHLAREVFVYLANSCDFKFEVPLH
jgi:hypothetical protein